MTIARETSGFGTRFLFGRTQHNGIDYAVPVGTNVYINKPMTVITAREMPGYGNTLQLRDSDGLIHTFGHLSQIVVKHGDTVEANQLVAYTGGGRGQAGSGQSTGPHLHYDVRDASNKFFDPKAINPKTGEPYQNAAGFTPGQPLRNGAITLRDSDALRRTRPDVTNNVGATGATRVTKDTGATGATGATGLTDEQRRILFDRNTTTTQAPSASRSPDDRASGATGPRVIVTAKRQRVVKPNPLEQYSNYSYGISLHAMTIQKYNQVCVDGTSYTTNDNSVLIASGGRRSNDFSRNQYFENDMYFENFKMDCFIGLNAQTRASNVVDISFTVHEPVGVSLLDRILLVAQEKQIKQWDLMPFVIQIDFFANTDSGDVLNLIPDLTKRVVIKIIDIQITVSGRGAEYRITALPQAHVAQLQTVSTIPLNIEITAQTVGEYFDSKRDSDNVNPRSDTTPNSQTQVKARSLPAALNAYQKFLQTNNKKEHADTYVFEIDSEIAQAKIFNASSNATVTVPSANKENSNLQLQRGAHKITAGTNIKEVINQILASSDFYKENIDEKNSSDEKAITVHKITHTVKYGEFDKKTNLYQKTITYKVNKYEYFNQKYPEAAKGFPKLVDKEYNYVYTGKNQQILDLKIDFNTMFYTVVTAFEQNQELARIQAKREKLDNDSDRDSKDPLTPNRALYSPGADRHTALDQGDRKSIESSDFFRSLMQNSRGDMLNIQITIAGDPDLIKQDELFSPRQSSTSIPTDQGQIFCTLNFRFYDDIDQDSGLYKGGKTSVFSGKYSIVTVKNIFERGQFTQILDCIRLPEQPTTPSQSAVNDLYARAQDLINDNASDAEQQAGGLYGPPSETENDETVRLANRYPLSPKGVDRHGNALGQYVDYFTRINEYGEKYYPSPLSDPKLKDLPPVALGDFEIVVKPQHPSLELTGDQNDEIIEGTVKFPDGRVMEAFAVKPSVSIRPRTERQINVQFGNKIITGLVSDRTQKVYFLDFSLE